MYALYNVDCIDLAHKLPDNSIHYVITSPPFSSLYTYSDYSRDMGNCKGDDEFFAHFDFLIKELYRILLPGRLISLHCMNLPSTIQHNGYIGIRDFRGDLIRAFQRHGFIYHSEVCIWKDPVIAMQRTKALGLLHKQVVKDSTMSRQGIPEYLVTLRKPGKNEEPVSGGFEYFVGENPPAQKGDEKDSINIWQRYASPVWHDINPSNTLQYQSARDNNDERHICPLALSVIERGIQLWTNPNDIVFDPFTGIGSTGYVVLQRNRRFVGSELKPSYYECAKTNLEKVSDKSQLSLF